MPKISNQDIYNQDDTLSMNDYTIGSNSNTGNKKTQTYTFASIFSLFYNFLGYNAFLNTTDTTTYPIGTPGCFYVFDENDALTSDFSEARKITFSSYDTYNFYTANYFNIIVSSGKFLFKLINLEDKNNFVFLNPSNFVLSGPGTTFDVDVLAEAGLSNGSFVNYKRYLLVLEFAAGTFDPADYDLSDFTNTSGNPFITLQDLPNISTLLREEFVFSGSQTFTLANNYAQVYSIEVQGQGALSTSQYNLIAPNQITINDALDSGDYIVIIYSDASAGVVPYYTQGQTDSLILANSVSNKYIKNETPLGAIDGINAIFTTQFSLEANSEDVFVNGQKQIKPSDYNISGQTITFTFSPNIDEIITINYIKQ